MAAVFLFAHIMALLCHHLEHRARTCMSQPFDVDEVVAKVAKEYV